MNNHTFKDVEVGQKFKVGAGIWEDTYLKTKRSVRGKVPSNCKLLKGEFIRKKAFFRDSTSVTQLFSVDEVFKKADKIVGDSTLPARSSK